MDTEFSIKLLRGKYRLMITGDLVLLPELLNSLIVEVPKNTLVFNPAPEQPEGQDLTNKKG